MPLRLTVAGVSTLACGFVLCCISSGYCEAGKRPGPASYYVQPWQVEDGLPDSSVSHVLQDRDGYIWLATIAGLVRFDGVEFKSFTSPLVAGVAARNIRSLVQEDDSTLLMLPAIGGVVRFHNGVFSLHPMSADVAGKPLETLFVEPGGAIWAGLSDASVLRWQNGHAVQFGRAEGLNRTGSRVSFAADQQGVVWVASGDFLGCYHDGKLERFAQKTGTPEFVASSRSGGIWIWSGDELQKMDHGQISTLSTNVPWSSLGGVVRDMFEDSQGNLWIGTSAHGLYRFANGEFTRVATSHNGISSIIEDREGSLWVGMTGGGLNRLCEKVFTIYNTRSGLLEDVTDALCVDDRGDVWFANRSGGVARLGNGRIHLVRLQGGKIKLAANAVCADDAGYIWVGTGSGIARFQRDTPEQVTYMGSNISGVHVLFKSRNGDVWVGAEPQTFGYFHEGEFHAFSPEAGFTGRSVRAIAEDSSGTIWVGTEGGQLFRLANGKFTKFGPEDGLPEVPIRALYADHNEVVWIGTLGGGLVVRRNDRFTRITPADGLTDDLVAGILEDDAGRLWFGSRRGLFHAAKRDLLAFADGAARHVNFVTFGRSEGLSGVYCLGTCQPMAWKADGGRLWFATQQGVLALESAALKSNLQPPPVFIDEFVVNDQPFSMADPIKVPPIRKKLEFRFSVLSYSAPEKVRIRHQLENVDSDWIETSQRVASYGGLLPGDYRLRVTACNGDGIWNDTGATLAFTVLPAWWQSWWFRGAAGLVFTGTVVSSVRVWSHRRLKLRLERLEHQRALEKERARIARDLHDDLGASLTQIGLQADLTRGQDVPPEELKRQAAQLATQVRTLAHELDAIVWSVNPKNDSLDKLVTYLCQFSQEFFRLTPIRCRLDVGEDIPACPLTPEVRHDLFLVTKEAMNNVVKHSTATEVWLRLAVRNGVFHMLLEDNGCGFSLAELEHSDRNGLRNMRARVEEFGGTFELRSQPGQGTTLGVSIPLASPAFAGQQNSTPIAASPSPSSAPLSPEHAQR